MKTLNVLAAKLMSCDHVAADDIHKRLERVKERWERLRKRIVERKTRLENMLQVYSFKKSCDELCDNINEKVLWFIFLGNIKFLRDV